MNEKNNYLTIPNAILLAGVIIAGSIFYSAFSRGENGFKIKKEDNSISRDRSSLIRNANPNINLREISDRDHIRGNPEAPIKIVEYSDTECPFCQRFHRIMIQIMDEYGQKGKVAWIYRHFPLDSLHSKARKEAEATECAAELGGNEKFWAYLDRLFEITPSNDQLDPAQLPQIATFVGLKEADFVECLNSGRHAQRVAEDLADAERSGGEGTPWTIIITPKGEKIPLSGAKPYSVLKNIIDSILEAK
jgi:protein-disulfide isomerase